MLLLEFARLVKVGNLNGKSERINRLFCVFHVDSFISSSLHHLSLPCSDALNVVGGGHKTTAAALESDIRTVVIITSGRKVIVDSRAKRVIG